ncbi:hypothetical protein K443DRAFT_566901 [Laccaria amethystina LaAM-08-1]|uniref:General stress protein FMN-binding split barrel domain-containing protein n=1 Tax=Laccaria amethystina LaAM-08-1 TaxID=1095629 RepID=A0A0C9X8L7_9AGAR|nr:hypothetical protein K443DRAFT_566901 [Laccaria amethystina LaAM-08-1]
MTSISLDPYSTQAKDNKKTLEEKIIDLKKIIKSTNTAMLTTRGADGHIHSRAMNPVHPSSEMDLSLLFIANNVSHKFEEIQNDAHVNVSFLNPETTNWASFSGKAKIIQDRQEIKKHWTLATASWFGDLGDGIHKGDENDPRVAVIEVVPDEIRYWYTTKGKSGKAPDVEIGAVTGRVACPGELRTISQDEIQLPTTK